MLKPRGSCLLGIHCRRELPQVIWKHGPLYEGIQHLISEEKTAAEQIWNDTKLRIETTANEYQKAQNYLRNFEEIFNEKIQQIREWQQYEELQKCYKQYERQIARFNRNLIYKFRVCRQALNSSLSQLEDEIRTEVLYIRDAAIEIQEVVYDCNVTDLKSYNEVEENYMHGSHVTMCVISKLSAIRQQQFEARHISLEILGRIVASDIHQNEMTEGNGGGDGVVSRPKGDNVCLEFRHLREEFETIYDRILRCIVDGK
ncbi:uncharacterized protein LOC133332708 [Musca vetustissima]|uniref:uncharacterized protein LOC133332708 n=1 Tax=Musca vetustissima TaxID=27455 RepID=UPI002AB73B43|nr:uncharacterized protein LOC133332708 [Musca vetustissima]